MYFEQLSIEKLIINPENDRHGPLDDEQSSIEWFFKNKPKEMMKIANDIAASKRVYDPILVKERGGKFIVFDGNRRTTCVKLIHNPNRAPRIFQARFEQLNKDISSELSKKIFSQVEVDQDIIDRIIERRHNGTQGGVGQLNWDTYAKANQANRVSGKSDYSTAQLIEQFLRKHKAFDQKKVNRSTVEKIADTKARRTRIGFVVENDKLVPLRDTPDLIKVFSRIMKDAITGQLTLNDLLRSEQKNNYLDILETDGTMPPYETASSKPTPTQINKVAGAKKPSNIKIATVRPKSVFIRDTLIPRLDFGIQWAAGQNKIFLLWTELQTNLKLPKNKVSTAIVFRVLLELIADKYTTKHLITSKGKLSKDWLKIIEHQYEKNLFDDKNKKDFIKRVSDENSISAIPHLHRVVHSKSEISSADDLKSLWDSLENLIVNAIKG